MNLTCSTLIAKIDDARKCHEIKWKERLISEKDRTLSWREQELRKTRAEIL